MPDTDYLQAGPWPEPQVITVDEVPTVVVDFADVAMSDLPEQLDKSFAALGQCIGQGRFTPKAAAVSVYRRIDPEDPRLVDGQVGFPVTEPLIEAVDVDGVLVAGSHIPAGEVMALTYWGGYDGLSGAWQTLMAAIKEAGREPSTPFWEVYVTEPTPDKAPAQLRTDLYCLLA